MGRLRVPEIALRSAVFGGIALVLLTPFVVTPATIFPYVVGKALWSRSAIEAVFALWVVLALAHPAYRPPRSWVLVALGAGLAVAGIAGSVGASPQRSLWSTYERMQGVVDSAHWVALAVVLASVLRTAAAWRALLGLHAGAGTAMACFVIARHFGLEIPFYGALPESHWPRMSGPLGNPTYLSLYLLASLVTAVGLAVRAWLPAPAAPRGQRRMGRGPKAPATAATGPLAGRTAGFAWACGAALQLWGLALAGSVGGFAGLAASVGFVAATYALLARGRGRWAAVAVLGVLGAAAIALGVRFVDAERPATLQLEHPIARYVAQVHLQRPSVQSRLAAWHAGFEGFADRPVLGWGPENFEAVFGRFASGYGIAAEPHDQAHSKLVEVAATTGALGVAAFLALWALAFCVVWRAARAMQARARALAVFAGAALAGLLVQSLFLFDTAAGSLHAALLLAFVASLEPGAFPERRLPRLPAALARAGWRPGGWRVGLGVAAISLALGGLTVNQAIYAAAEVRYQRARSEPWESMADGIAGFGPLANTWRWWLFEELAHEWTELRAADRDRARELLGWAEREAAVAVRTEPASWRMHRSVAALYQAAASTDPDYAGAAREALTRARSLAPQHPQTRDALGPPEPTGIRRLRDGRHALNWRPAPDAGYHQIGILGGGGARRAILYTYDPGRTAFVAPAPSGPGPWRYRIKACRHPGDCSAWVEWPAAARPAAGAP